MQKSTFASARRVDPPYQYKRKPNARDRTGERYGKIVVLGRAGTRVYGSRGQNMQATWRCQCDCGEELIVSSAHLNAKRSWNYGCGCGRTGPREKIYRLRKGYEPGEAAKKSVIKQYRYSAKHRGLEHILTDAEMEELVTADCHYCGCPPSITRRPSPSGGEFIFNGIDRIDSAFGYAPDNCVTCCITCNRAKHAMPYVEFIAWLDRLVAYRNQLTPDMP